ncbi:MAG TPA: hypothetical protein VGB85_13785 [Nannocystis sp.]
MTWEYHLLKRQLGLVDDPLLHLFERFCERAYAAMDTMEWSWKFSGSQVLANRVFWLGAGGHREATGRHLLWLTDALGLRAEGHPGGLAAWRELVGHGIERALVAYAGPNLATGRGPVVKFYLTLDPRRVAEQPELARPPGALVDDLSIPAATGVLRCHTVELGGAEASRMYYLFTGADHDDPATAALITRLAGPRGAELARLHPRSGVAFKADGTDMLGLALRATGAEGPHPAQILSPVLVPLLAAAGRSEALYERLDRVTWVTVPLDEDSLRLPRVLREMNVYVRLR